MNVIISRAFFLSILMCLFQSASARPQQLTPVIELTAEETAKTKQYATDLENADNRLKKADDAYKEFDLAYHKAHPELPAVRFSADFRMAVEPPSTPSWADVGHVTIVELTRAERQKLEAVQREIVESRQSLDHARKVWRDYQVELLAAHLESGKEGTVVNLASGRSFMIPIPWANGLAFTPDFRFAIPRD